MDVFEINGFFKDDKSKFESYLVTDYDSTPEGYKDDDFFFYGLSESEIIESIGKDTGVLDFVITSYSRVG